MNDMPMPQDNSEDADSSMMVSKTALGPSAANLKVGDTVEMTVANIQGDMISLSPAAADAEDVSEDDQNPQTMPLDKLEASLPKAARE